ncbi:Hemolysin activation/secretion protein [Marinospirillum celere]|uniref:Hemolysin activation/secretion protein n=1 Tax=Marinospirillum celere TaxID=1122252 RepID=A0A1I1JVW4_9GAMM|nr:ShlB/FhaC/HecB family hemolysin secretion/activation protein [Marinospirillum celere]SFC49510.1 Hemolysin activation/secretion protein [Marinospirillum celere]
MSLPSHQSYSLLAATFVVRHWLIVIWLPGCLVIFLPAALAETADPQFAPGIVRPDIQAPRLPPQPPASVLEIPPLVERPFAEEAGERVEVKRFRLEDARDLPEHNISLDELETLLEEARADRPDGFTIGQLERVADKVTNYYRSRGLILAKAVIPVQTVDEGLVTIQVIEGKLGRVLGEGNELYSTATLARAFGDLKGQPVSQAEAESGLLILTDFPGLAAFGMFQPGQRVGEADLLIRVPNEDRFNFDLRADNHGSDTTGEYRTRGTLRWNNVTGNADRLTVTAQQSFEPMNSQFGSLDYHVILNRQWQAGANLSYNQFDVGGEFANLDISGNSTSASLYTDRIWLRSRERNFSTRIGINFREAITERNGDSTNEDRLTYFKISLNYDSVDTRLSGLNYAGLELSQGLNDFLGSMGTSDSSYDLPQGERPSRRGATQSGGRLPFAEGQFTKLLAFYSRLQNLTSNSSLLLRTELQYSPDLLVPMEQYAVGGADHLRGFPSSWTMYDSGALLSLEYILQAPFIGDRQAYDEWRWRDLLQFSIFYDHAYGEKNDPFPNEPQGLYQLSSLGMGTRLNLPNQLSSRLQIAVPVIDESDNDDEESAQVWFDITYHF